MSLSLKKTVQALVTAFVLGALGLGARQAFASATTPQACGPEYETTCKTRTECNQYCQANYGVNGQCVNGCCICF